MTQRIRNITCEQVASALERDANGDEQIMKEVWEECSHEELKIAEDELRQLIAIIRARIMK